MNLPWAWASRALLHLLVDEPYEALDALAQLIRLCEPPGDPSALRGGARSAGAALRCRPRTAADPAMPSNGWSAFGKNCRASTGASGPFCWALAAAVKDEQAIDDLREFASWGQEEPFLSSSDRIIVLSGGCTAEMQNAIDAFKPVLLRACEGLSFTLFGGGTTAGISGLAGDVAQQSAGRVRAFGYLPRLLPRGVQEDFESRALCPAIQFCGLRFQPAGAAARLDRYPCRGHRPPPRQASQLCRRTNFARRVRHCRRLGGAGGRGRRRDLVRRSPIQRASMAGVLQPGSAPHGRHDPPRLPPGGRTSLQTGGIRRGRTKGPRGVCQAAIPKEPSLLPWEDLPEALKVSNFHQVAYAENILRTAGLGVRPMHRPR